MLDVIDFPGIALERTAVIMAEEYPGMLMSTYSAWLCSDVQSLTLHVRWLSAWLTRFSAEFLVVVLEALQVYYQQQAAFLTKNQIAVWKR